MHLNPLESGSTAMPALIDFLLGDSVDDIAVRYRLSRDGAEAQLRGVLLAYGFEGDHPSRQQSCT